MDGTLGCFVCGGTPFKKLSGFDKIYSRMVQDKLIAQDT